MNRDLSRKQVAVAGMGVSGLAVARAVQALGGQATVFDQSPCDTPSQIKAVDEIAGMGAQAVTGWHGRLDPQAFDKLVVSPGFPRNHPAIRDMLGGGRPVVSEVEFAYGISAAPILAITGTNGKSTTTVMLWLLIREFDPDALLCGNIAGTGYPEQPLTLAALNAAPGQPLIAEISSYQLEWVDEFCPIVAGITNVTPDHMDRHADFQDYFETKVRIAARMGAGETFVVNEDEPSLLSLPGRVKASVVRFSPSGKSQPGGITARLGGHLQVLGHEVALADLPIHGEHNVTNLMMAMEMAAAFLGERADPGRLLSGAMKFKSLANRMEYLGAKDGIAVINNSMCTNPAAVVASSRSIAGRQRLLMGGNTKRLDFAPVKDYLAGSAHKVYLFGPDPDVMDAMLGGGWPRYAALEDAFHAAVAESERGDTILLAPGCASAEPYANFKERGEAFRSIAKEWLES